ncbi:ABC transporter permease [Vescimonas sp.]|uniref:ABC transporter permease n=1 Tax=Vescimonas sp. TaxID=2892404 RepID=UPI003F80F93C
MKKQSRVLEIWDAIRRNKAAMLGLVILLLFILITIFADLIAPYELVTTQTRDILQPPSAQHWFGTDDLGRDVFARVIHATRVSLAIGLIATVLSVLVGGILGSVAGYKGGKLDEFLMRLMDALMCIPSTLLALAIVAALGTSMTNLILAITISSVPGVARVIRAVIINIVDEDYITAAISYSENDYRIITRYVLPNAVGPVIVYATMSISATILTAAGLSFIGMGVQPPTPEWGYMISEAQGSMRYASYLIMFPGFALLLASLAFNLLGDGLQDALDPKMRD